MKKVYLIIFSVFLIGSTASAQFKFKFPDARRLVADAVAETVPHQDFAVSLFTPVETPQATTYTLVDGFFIQYGPLEFIYHEQFPNVGPDTRLFTDTINSGDSWHFTNPHENFGVNQGDSVFLMFNRLAYIGTERPRYIDTVHVRLIKAGSFGRTKYRIRIMIGMQQARLGKFVDLYNGRQKLFVPSDTTAYFDFEINPADAPNTGSKMENRFLMILSKYPWFTPPLPQVGPQHHGEVCTVYPNPVAKGNNVYLSIKQPHERVSIVLYDLNRRVIKKQLSTWQPTISFAIPAMVPPGMYLMSIIPDGDQSKQMMQKIFVK